MRINLIAVGKRIPAWVDTSFKEYCKRLSGELAVNLVEITPASRTNKSPPESMIKKEIKRIESVIPKGNLVIALDENGIPFSSKQFAKKIEEYMQHGQDVSIIIGGADGLGETFKNSVDEVWSLSNMTLPHALARVIVVEQIYRAWTIINNHPYHRE